MRRTAVLVALCLVVACGGDGTEHRSPPTSTVEEVTPSAQTALTTTSTTTEPSPTTSTPTESGDGTESIGVTDEVTIVVSDPEDG